MKFLAPLGFLGLLGIAVLILIYIIKPNFQQKLVSSTYMWKLSLKYKKKRIPISKLRNLLIILCQILAIAACAAILAQPNKVLKSEIDNREVILLLDSSASMRTENEEGTRFVRAIDQIKNEAEQVFASNGTVSVIIADNQPDYLCQRVTANDREKLITALDELQFDEMACSFGRADIDEALTLCEPILLENPKAQIKVYTDNTYSYVPEDIELVNVRDAEEWNAAILDAYTVMEENYYSFYVDLACYGRDMEVELTLDIYGVNALDNNDNTGRSLQFKTKVFCTDDTTMTAVFKRPGSSSGDDHGYEEQLENYTFYFIENQSDWVYNFQSIHVSIDVFDSYSADDSFDIYGGQKEVLKVQYATTSNGGPFFESALLSLYRQYRNDGIWDFQITQVKDGNYATSGFDFYIFEHKMPSALPTDGVVLLSNPDIAPIGSDIQLGNVTSLGRSESLSPEEPHDIMYKIKADYLTVFEYTPIKSYGSDYKVLMSFDVNPMLLVKNTEKEKVVIMPFSLHYSNLAARPELSIMMYNIFEYFIPTTVRGRAFEVNSEIELKARGSKLTVTDSADNEQELTEFPAKILIDIPGTYTLRQTTFADKEISENIYVRTPKTESNIRLVENSLTSPYRVKNNDLFYKDLIVFVACALVALLFIEWLLQIREGV